METKKLPRPERRALNIIWTAAGLIAVITLFSCIFTSDILRLMDTPSDIFSMSYDYLIVMFGGMIFTMFYNVLSAILRALGDTKTPLVVLAIAAALQRDIPIYEYAPRKVKMSVTGSGTASKEQIALLLRKFMTIHTTSELLDETDAIAIAYCHFIQSTSPLLAEGHACKTWDEYIKKNPGKVR